MQLQPESPWLREAGWHGDLSRGAAADCGSPEKAVASAKLIKSTATDLEIKCGRRKGGGEGRGGGLCPSRGAAALSFWCDSRYVSQTKSFRERRWGTGEENQLFFICIDCLQ